MCLSTPRYVVVYQAQAVNATEHNCKRESASNPYTVAMLDHTYPSGEHKRIVVSKRSSQTSYPQVKAPPYQDCRSNLPYQCKSWHPTPAYWVDIVWCRPAFQNFWRNLLDVPHRLDNPRLFPVGGGTLSKATKKIKCESVEVWWNRRTAALLNDAEE